jgi:hypothetical protein
MRKETWLFSGLWLWASSAKLSSPWICLFLATESPQQFPRTDSELFSPPRCPCFPGQNSPCWIGADLYFMTSQHHTAWAILRMDSPISDPWLLPLQPALHSSEWPWGQCCQGHGGTQSSLISSSGWNMGLEHKRLMVVYNELNNTSLCDLST